MCVLFHCCVFCIRISASGVVSEDLCCSEKNKLVQFEFLQDTIFGFVIANVVFFNIISVNYIMFIFAVFYVIILNGIISNVLV